MSAALNTLREERRRVVEALAAVFADAALKAQDGRHWRALMRQMANELVDHDRAVVQVEARRYAVARARMTRRPAREAEARP